MKTTRAVVSAIAATAISFSALAQTPSSTEEARAMLSRVMSANAVAAAFERPKPDFDYANASDYLVEWRNEARLAHYLRFQRSLQQYEAGVRSIPIAVDSTESARQEAARASTERRLAGYVAYMQASPAARLAHSAALAEQSSLAKRW